MTLGVLLATCGRLLVCRKVSDRVIRSFVGNGCGFGLVRRMLELMTRVIFLF